MPVGGPGGPPVFIPTLAPGLGYGGPSIAARGQVTAVGVASGDTITIGVVTLTAANAQTSGGLNFDELAPTYAVGAITATMGSVGSGTFFTISTPSGLATLTATSGFRTPGNNDFRRLFLFSSQLAAEIAGAINDPLNSFTGIATAQAVGSTVQLTAVQPGAGGAGYTINITSIPAAALVPTPFAGGGFGADPPVAASIVAAINDPGNGLTSVVTANAVGAVVTTTAVNLGVAGNSLVLVSSTPARLPVTGQGFLEGGYGEGGAYGYTPYGHGTFPRHPIAPMGGYGGAPYGTASYGSVDITPPRMSSAVSLDGYRIEVFFSEAMTVDAALCDPASYTVTPTIGAPATVTVVLLGTQGTFGGYTSVILTHTGTTTGGTYTVVGTGMSDLAGNLIGPPPANSSVLLTLGDTATYTVNAPDGETLEFAFFRSDVVTSQDMLTEAGFTPGIEDASNYSISTTYPIGVTIGTITHPGTGGLDTADMAVTSMTSAGYTSSVSPADAVIYDGTILPSAATTFAGVEFGTGSSSASSSSKLLLSKSSGPIYGWSFGDTSGKLLPGSSYRMSFAFDATTAFFAPPLFNTTAATLVLNDGGIEVTFIFTRVGGVDAIDIVSGAFSASVPATWSSTATTVELYRNQKAGHFAVLVNGVPVVSTPVASFTGIPTVSVGASFALAAVYAASTFKVTGLTITSSSTVFTSAWNFLHSVTSSFTGSPAIANDRIMTERGPLTKGWGDATPATEQDVAVRINGTPVDVDRINPYIGAIFPTIPIPLAPPGTNSIEVDYTWFPAPQMAMAGLNTLGLILNKHDQPRGHTSETNPLPSSSLGAKDTARFPMAVVLPPLERPQPVLIGHRYIGYEQGYTASLNSPTTLLLNQNPHRVSVPDLSKDVEGAFATFDGTTTPPLAETRWLLEGVDSGEVIGDGTYRVVDDQAGSFEVGDATVYYRDENLACPVTVNQVARFQVESYTADGVFTGIGFGFHDNFQLYLGGALVINGVRHIGLLTDASKPHLAESWELGPAATGTIIDGTTVTVPLGQLPGGVEPGTRFQIFEGSQVGVYTIAECGVDPVGATVTITIEDTNPFPADPGLYGNDTATLVFETPWDTEFLSYRLIVDVDDQIAQFFVGGTLLGQAITLTEPTAIPADTSLLIPTSDEGRLMFGSFSRIAVNSTLWSFHRYDVIPDQATVHVRGIVVAAEMSDPPESDANHEWFFTNRFGLSEIDSSADTLLLKSTSADDTGALDLTYGYARIEPLLTRKVFIDVDATFKVESGVLGAGDAIVRVRDDLREAKLATILYREGGTPYRQLISLPQVSLSGLLLPSSDGWAEATSPTFSLTDVSVRQNIVTINQTLGQSGIYQKTLDSSIHDSGGRVIDARIRVVSWTANASGFAGPTFAGVVGLSAGTMKWVILALKDAIGANPARISVLDTSLTEITSFDFDWTDGAFHDIRSVATTSGASIVADDTVLGTVAFGVLSTATVQGQTHFGTRFSDTVSQVEWDSFHIHALPLSPEAKRTLGVYKAGDPDDINSWVIPRTDGTTALNSSSTAVPEEMDWTSLVKVRVHLDPTWGVSVYRPDLPLPPYFTGNFATQITDPTAAWINLEYRRLPKHDDVFGSVAFGALDPRSVTQQRWAEVRYRLYNTPSEEFIAPHHMVLNQFNVITSGEYNLDVTPEVVTVQSLTATLVSIRSAHMNADRVFVVVVDGAVIPVTQWSFDETSQVVTLTNPLPSVSYPVTITFAPGKPVTKTYLCEQPLEGSVTQLNEGTPPVPMSQQATTTATVVSGSTLNDPSDTLNDDPDFILNDPFQTIEFALGPESLYDCLEFCTVDDGGATGLLSIACDGPAPEQGLIELELEGRMLQDGFSVPDGPGGRWGSSSPTIKGSASSFDQTHIFMLSGGNYTGPVLGPAGNSPLTVFYPNYPGPNGPHRGQDRGVNQEIQMVLQFTTPFEDTFPIPATADNTPPSLPYTESLNPDGTPGTQLHGAALAETTEYAATGVSRLGPWGGLEALSVNSLLAGGAPLDGTEFILNGGAPLTPPVVTTTTIEAAN